MIKYRAPNFEKQLKIKQIKTVESSLAAGKSTLEIRLALPRLERHFRTNRNVDVRHVIRKLEVRLRRNHDADISLKSHA